jgi:hypothetical protein
VLVGGGGAGIENFPFWPKKNGSAALSRSRAASEPY